MNQISERIKKNLLPFVMKPGKYVGNELNSTHKDHQGKLKVALAFPDTYEIGMSYLGLSIIYHLINKNPNWLAERTFTPWVDVEELMKKEEIPLFSLESHTPLREFDVIGFSLTYELNYTNVLNMLDLAQIPVWSSERDERYPLVIAGGPCTMNPEPVADFIDLFAVGDAEEMVEEILHQVQASKENGATRREQLIGLSKIPGVYVPQFYDAKYGSSGRFERTIPNLPDVPEKVKARTVSQLKSEYYPPFPIVPFLETTHDRLTIEIMRGCPNRCRFCAATVAYQPKRERPVDDIIKQAEEGIANSGWDEISLLSLSTTDYSKLPELARMLSAKLSTKKVSISLPSMRPSTFSLELAKLLARVKKSGLTFAPEAGTNRLRNAIGKHLDEQELVKTARIAFSSGWNLIKLYFMIGLPTETEKDINGIVKLIREVLAEGKEVGRRSNINVTISPFTPKPHTPFQWERMEDIESLQKKVHYLKTNCRRGNVHLKFRDPQVSYLEGILSRGDRKIASVIHSAWRKGAKLDGWSEHFNYHLWKEAFVESGLDMGHYAREKELDSPLPWGHIDRGVREEFLKKERNRAYVTLEEKFIEEKNVSEINRQGHPPAGEFKIGDFASNDKLQEAISPREESSETSPSFGRKKKKKPLSPTMSVARSRVRLRWSKSEEVRFTSHLDVGRTFERAIRRSGIPIAYSEGFHPHQKVAFGPPLPLGYISEAEYLDIQLNEPYTSTIFSRLNRTLPHGFMFSDGRTILGKSDSLSSILNLAFYEVNLDIPLDRVEELIRAAMECESLLVKRASKEKIKEIDIKKHVLKLECVGSNDKVLLKMQLGLGTDGYARPEEVLIYGLGLEQKDVAGMLFKRTGLFVRKGDRILTPMETV